MFKQETKQPITVLGLTFKTEEERREYFREELRKRLPELKKMEGFPIGKDEDILNLSDPPYYTACPNPWLNDFIGEWEDEKKELKQKGHRNADFEVDDPYAIDVTEGKTNPIYLAHSYHTKVPHPAIMRYILHYTQPGDIVFDGFAGTGMTGVAASLCQKPEEGFRILMEGENRKVKWGKRNAICGDLSPLASLISGNYNCKADNYKFYENAISIIDTIEKEYSWLYKTKETNTNNVGDINYVVWSDVFLCPNCSEELIFYNEAVDRKIKKVKNEFNCSSCSVTLNKKKLEKCYSTIYDSISKTTKHFQKQVPVLINYKLGKKRFEKIFDDDDQLLIDKIDNVEISNFFPNDKLVEGFNTTQPKNSHGFTEVYDFYTKRNLLLLSVVWSRFKNDLNPTWIFYPESYLSTK